MRLPSRLRLLSIVAAAVISCAGIAGAQTPVTTLSNPSFELGTPGTAANTGWTTIPGLGPLYIAAMDNPGLDAIDPASAHSGSYFVTGNHLVSSDTANQSRGIMQDVDLTPYFGEIALGSRRLDLSFAYNDADPADSGEVSFNFLNSGGVAVGSAYSFSTNTAPTGGGAWLTGSLIGDIPVDAATMRLSLRANQGTSGVLRNISYDSLAARILPPPPPSGIVHGNLIQFDGSGAWTWYSDERAIVDPNNGHVLVNSVGFSPSYPSGGVDVVNFDPQTGRRVRTPLSTIQVDDHNNGSLLVLPDGRYLAMYANHGNNGGLGDEFSRWRRSINPGDSTSWTAEQTFNWFNAVPGANQTGNPDAANVSYHNLFYLSEEEQVYDISRSYGRLSTNGASQNMPNILRYDIATNTVQWAGQLLESAAQGYSAYPKYASNGVDRIYFISTETHPRNFNNSVFSGYIENGQTFDMHGMLIDADIFDNGTAAGGSGFVPDVNDFTPVQLADPLGDGHNRLWTVDMNLDADGNPMALYISRWNPDGLTSDGGTNNPIDHRIHFGRWNSETSQWETHEVAKMGNRLYRGTDMSEQDYTGNAALVPGDPSTIYVSTPYDPRDPSGETFTTSYEIYKGVTADGGASWNWTAVTENSVVDNLRPIVPDPRGGPTTVIWFRGVYTTAHNINAAVVGIVERPDEQLGPVKYVDANSSNTVYADGSALQTSTPSGNQGAAENLWHERTGFGNGGSVLTSSESGAENAPMLKTTIDGSALSDGVYDAFAYFWSDDDEDWRLLAGLEQSNLIDFRRFGSQHAEADHFDAIETVSANGNDLQLYRAYLGRAEVADGADIDVFIDDWQSFTGGAIRTWFDGVGYSLVTTVAPGLAGDFNDDGIVDAVDYTVWRNHLGEEDETNLNHNGDGGDIGPTDYALWKLHYGESNSMPGGGGLAQAAVPEPEAIALLSLFALAAASATRRLRTNTAVEEN